MTSDKLFVYGTLKGMNRPGVRYLCEGIVSGALYDLGSFPGAKLDEDGLIEGEIFEVQSSAWEPLDRYEGAPDLYKRVEVMTVDGIKVWVYHYNGTPPTNSLIEDGIW